MGEIRVIRLREAVKVPMTAEVNCITEPAAYLKITGDAVAVHDAIIDGISHDERYEICARRAPNTELAPVSRNL